MKRSEDQHSKIILRGTQYPCEETKVFKTDVDNQTEFQITILEGNNDFADYCYKLSETTISGIEPAPRG